jgi:hypothetical protein
MAWPVVEEDLIGSQKLMNFGVGFNEGGKKRGAGGDVAMDSCLPA